MIQSMTGFGTAEHVDGGVSYALEVRVVNHRYLKISIKLPDSLQFADPLIEKVIRKRFARGSVSYSLRSQCVSEERLSPIDGAALQAYVDRLATVSLPDGVQATLDLAIAATLPGVIRPPAVDDESKRQVQDMLVHLTERALDAVTVMRNDEGQALRQDLLGIRSSLQEHLEKVRELGPTVIDEYHERLKTRVATLMSTGKFELQADSLAREVALFAERCDVAEEITRLKSHLDQFADLCERTEPVGRTMDFLAQELLREANTIASKSNDAAITRNVVEMKALIDRLKEQVQNIE